MKQEIERKFLINETDHELFCIQVEYIHQTYLVNSENESLRVRRTNIRDITTYEVTYKRGVGIVRDEIEFEISEDAYNQILDGKNLIPLRKTRLKISEDDFLYDLDLYKSKPFENLKIIEIEFSSEEEANNFIPPSWFGEEVTGQRQYLNQNLWQEINQGE